MKSAHCREKFEAMLLKEDNEPKHRLGKMRTSAAVDAISPPSHYYTQQH